MLLLILARYSRPEPTFTKTGLTPKFTGLAVQSNDGVLEDVEVMEEPWKGHVNDYDKGH